MDGETPCLQANSIHVMGRCKYLMRLIAAMSGCFYGSFLIKNFIAYFPVEGILQIAPQIWQSLHYYEVLDILKSTDEQLNYYIARHIKG